MTFSGLFSEWDDSHARTSSACGRFTWSTGPKLSHSLWDKRTAGKKSHSLCDERPRQAHRARWPTSPGGITFCSSVHIVVGDDDFYLDLLFYDLKLRCFVVIDLKMKKFTPEDAGKMIFTYPPSTPR
jgi:YhcG PDDEXK nuclease domain